MKVALVCDWFHPRVGGIESHLLDLALRLRARGHDVVVVTPTPGPDAVDSIRVRRVDAPRAPHFGFLMTPAGVRAVGSIIAAERPDVAHCHVSIVSPAALGGAREAARRGVPAVVTFHSVVPATRALAHVVHGALGTSRWPVRYSAVSGRVARDVAPIAGGRGMTILSNGVDVPFWRAEPDVPADGAFRLAAVMRLNPKKRPLALVDVVRRAAALAPNRRITLTVIGDGPRRASLERAVARHGLTDHIALLGARSRADVRQLLAASDAFLLPTIRESFGLAALEARCTGLPVVAMRASGVSEFITHGREGLLAASDAELARHVATLAVDEPLRSAIADHNRRTTPPFDWPAVVDAHLAAYRDAIALRDMV